MIRYLILAVVAFCLSLSLTTFATSVPPATLNSEGFYWLDQGNATTALERFRRAEAAYQQKGHSEGVMGAKANQMIALRRLGRLEEACELAAQTYKSTCWGTVLPTIPPSPSPAQTALLQGFVETLTDQKRFDRAIDLFEQVPTFNSASALFSGGYIYLKIAKSQTNLDASSRALESGRRLLSDALARANESHDKKLQLFAQASLLNLAGLEQQLFRQAIQIPSISIDALQALATPDQERVALLLAEGWVNLNDPQAKQVLLRAIASHDPAIKSRALLLQGQLDHSIQAFRQAEVVALQGNLWDLAAKAALYQGDWETLPKKAIVHYETAIRYLENSRSAGVFEPLEGSYRKYFKALIATRPIERLNLSTLLQQESALQRSLVEDFLQCRTTNLVDLSKIKLSSNTRQIYFIDLDENLLVLVRDSRQTQTVLIPISQAFKEALSSFRISLQGRFYELPVAQLNQRSYELYQTLIQPLEEKQLIQPGNQLLITADPNFYDLPFSMLWTGKQYLIENYQILNSLGGQTTEASAGISPVMIAAITDSSGLPPSYPDGIDSSIEAEVQNIKQTFKASAVLLNQSFQATPFLETVAKEGFHSLHVSTHGVFDATSRNPYLYAWDRKVTIAELNQALLQRSPLNLLVFSACETIRTNPRAIIGLASSAVQAQSRNLVASLWKVDAEATAKFMTEFYNQLRQGETPSDALQTAQIQLIKGDKETNHPYYWAGFLLFGVD